MPLRRRHITLGFMKMNSGFVHDYYYLSAFTEEVRHLFGGWTFDLI